MKISATGISAYLAKEDVASPFLAVMDFVRVEKMTRPPKEEKHVVHFVGESPKPVVLNATNKRTIIAAYGDETENWRGREIEIYVDPNVPNLAGEIVGGIRVRIPITQRAAVQPPRNSAPPVRKAPTIQALTADEKHRIVLAGYRNARDEAKVREFAIWADKQDFAPHHTEEQSDAFHAAIARIVASAKREPAFVWAGGEDIPF